MFEDLKLTPKQKADSKELGYIRLSLDDAITLLKPHGVNAAKIARSLGMARSNLRSQFSKGCVLDFYPETGQIKMTRTEETLKTGEL